MCLKECLEGALSTNLKECYPERVCAIGYRLSKPAKSVAHCSDIYIYIYIFFCVCLFVLCLKGLCCPFLFFSFFLVGVCFIFSQSISKSKLN